MQFKFPAFLSRALTAFVVYAALRVVLIWLSGRPIQFSQTDWLIGLVVAAVIGIRALRNPLPPANEGSKR